MTALTTPSLIDTACARTSASCASTNTTVVSAPVVSDPVVSAGRLVEDVSVDGMRGVS